MEHSHNQPTPQAPIPTPLSDKHHWLKMLGIGFSIVSLCVAIGLLGYYFSQREKIKFDNDVSPAITQPYFQSEEINDEPPLTREQLIGDYFAKQEPLINTKGRTYAEFGIYQKLPNDNYAKKIFSIGKAGEFVKQMILVKNKKIIIINLEKKLLVYNLATKKSSYIFSTTVADQFIDGMALSQNEERIAININGKNPELHIIIINLSDFSQKTFKKEMAMIDNEYGLWSLRPVFWFDNNKLYLAAILMEGGGTYRIIDTTTGIVTKTEIRGGINSNDGLKLAGAKQQAPYGGCNPPEDFDIYWYDLSTGKRTTILQQSNTVFKIIRWNQNNDEILYTAQKYTPDTRQCDGAVFLTPEVFVYNINKKQVKKVNSIKSQLNIWYPELFSFSLEQNIDPEKAFEQIPTISYLGSIQD